MHTVSFLTRPFVVCLWTTVKKKKINEWLNTFDTFPSVFFQLDSKAQGELKEGMKSYESEVGLKKSWDNVQKMVSVENKLTSKKKNPTTVLLTLQNKQQCVPINICKLYLIICNYFNTYIYLLLVYFNILFI